MVMRGLVSAMFHQGNREAEYNKELVDSFVAARNTSEVPR